MTQQEQAEILQEAENLIHSVLKEETRGIVSIQLKECLNELNSIRLDYYVDEEED